MRVSWGDSNGTKGNEPQLFLFICMRYSNLLISYHRNGEITAVTFIFIHSFTQASSGISSVGRAAARCCCVRALHFTSASLFISISFASLPCLHLARLVNNYKFRFHFTSQLLPRHCRSLLDFSLSLATNGCVADSSCACRKRFRSMHLLLVYFFFFCFSPICASDRLTHNHKRETVSIACFVSCISPTTSQSFP